MTDQKRTIRVWDTKEQLGEALAASLLEAAAGAISARGRFVVALSGGSVLQMLGAGLAGRELSGHKTGLWRVCFADERLVAADDEHRNDRQAREALFSVLPVREEQVLSPQAGAGASRSALEYERSLRELFGRQLDPRGLPRFDLILLGMGEDGHTASLFPGHRLLQMTGSWVLGLEDAPKPPPARVSLSLPVINAARKVVFGVAGSQKAPTVARALTQEATSACPASLVRPRPGELNWHLDRTAAGRLEPAQHPVQESDSPGKA